MEKYNEFLKVNYKIIVDCEGISEINLKDLFKRDWYELPWLVENRNCIYLITNLINGKVYVGQATYFYGRFVSKGFSHLNELKDPYNDIILQRALRKYKPKNFKVEILESNCDDLNEKEIHYIELFNSCIFSDPKRGYNMNYGGGYCDQLHTPEVNARRRQTNIDWYGNPYGAFRSEEAKEKAKATIASMYDGDPYGQIHTAESIKNK